jgi:hypothetical protein
MQAVALVSFVMQDDGIQTPSVIFVAFKALHTCSDAGEG